MLYEVITYNNQIKLLNDYFGNEPKSVLILTSLDYDIFCERFKSNHFKDRFYFIKAVDGGLEQQLIYYFYLNKGEISDIFYPAREFLGINHSYLKMIVITSYSIHYTKLYDPDPIPFRGCRLHRPLAGSPDR